MKIAGLKTIYQSGEEYRAARVLFKIIMGLLTVFPVIIVSGIYWGDSALIMITLIAGILLAVPVVLLFRGFLQPASSLFVVILFIMVTIIAVQGQGIHDFAVVVYPAVIIFSSLLMSRRAFSFCSILAVACMVFLVLGEAFGLFVTRPYDIPIPADLLVVLAVMLVTILSVQALADNMRRNIRLANEEIEKRKRIEARLRYLNAHDELTGVYNRAFFEEQISLLSRSRDFPVSIVVADLDDLKAFNDRFGHAAGDKLLKKAAITLGGFFRHGDVLARIGGDEFAVLLPRTDSPTTKLILDRLQDSLAKQDQRDQEFPLAISLGFSTAEKHGLKQAFEAADRQMYANKIDRKQDNPT